MFKFARASGFTCMLEEDTMFFLAFYISQIISDMACAAGIGAQFSLFLLYLSCHAQPCSVQSLAFAALLVMMAFPALSLLVHVPILARADAGDTQTLPLHWFLLITGTGAALVPTVMLLRRAPSLQQLV